MVEAPNIVTLNAIFNAIFVWLKGLTTQDILLIVLIVVTAGVPLFIYLLKRHKIPTLTSDDVWIYPLRSIAIYCLRVNREGGEGRAKDCEGFITINGKFESHNTAWWPSKKPCIDISRFGYLVLFQVEQDSIPIIRFPSGNEREGLFSSFHKYPLSEYEELKLSVGIESTRARVERKHFEKTIDRIIKEAKPMPDF